MPRRRRPRHQVVPRVISSLVLIFLGLVFLAPPQSSPYDSPPETTLPITVQTPSLDQPIRPDPALLTNKSTSRPATRIIIPSRHIDLPIVEAPIKNGFWELSADSASHGQGTANPGDAGHIVVFAHAQDSLFGPLLQIKPGSLVYLLTETSWHTYEVQEIFTVDPDQIEVIAPSKEETLTLFTCSGFADSKRLIIKALPKK